MQSAVACVPGADCSIQRQFAGSSEARALRTLDAEATAIGLAGSVLLHARPFSWLPS